jgi:hypothetical protein
VLCKVLSPHPLAELERAHAYWEPHGQPDQPSPWRYKTTEIAPGLSPNALWKWVDTVAPAYDLMRRCASCNRPEHLPSREAARLGPRKHAATFKSTYVHFGVSSVEAKLLYCHVCSARIGAELEERAERAQQTRQHQVGQQRTQQQQQRETAIDTVMQLGGEDRAGAVAYLDTAKRVTETAVGSAVMDRANGRPRPGQPLTSAWYFATLEAPGLFVLVAGSGGTMPTAPEHSWLSFTICEHKQASPLAEVRLCGRAGLNEWHEQHVGCHASLPTSDAVREVAIQLLRRHCKTAVTENDSA